MHHIPFSQVDITGGFWKTKQDLVKNTTVHAVYNRFRDTHRFDALRCAWKEGDPDMPHIFWDSDVAKWIEGVAYILSREKQDDLEALADAAIGEMIKNSDENGYFNSHYLVTEQDQRFQNRDCHELYCAGHLIEAAIAYREATGKDAFLKLMCRYADYIERIFKIEQSAAFATPGHPELELALVKLYRATDEQRYLELAKFFIDMHGHPEALAKDIPLYEWANDCYNQDDMPLRDRNTAEGHAVRALYLLCGMADVAVAYQDQALLNACKRVFSNIVDKRMYITGGVGSSYIGEAFTVDYHLPNRTAYAETCAAIALAMFCARMQGIEADSVYADTVERAIYNGFLSGMSMDGKAFFYENPLEIDPKFNHVTTSTKTTERLAITERLEVFECSCCPPNVVRFVPSIGGLMYAMDDETVYVHHYTTSEVSSGNTTISVTTDYPANGSISIRIASDKKRIGLRIPGWCRSFTLNKSYTMEKGYAYIDLEDETEIQLNLDMPVTPIAANRQVHDNAGRITITRGPIVYCIEGVDNGDDLKTVSIDPKGEFQLGDREFLLPALTATGFRPVESEALYRVDDDCYEAIPLRLIPYYAFANRGTTEMQVWLLKK